MATSDTVAVISDVGRKYLRLQLTDNIGPIRLRSLITHFGSLDAVLSASIRELQRVEGIGERVATSIFKTRNDDAVDLEIERAASCGLQIVCAEDAEYPRPLLSIPDPPICLYVRGKLEPTDAVAIAIVGARRCSHYGREQAVRFGQLLGRAGFTVISGMARGIDGHAHRGALQAGGRTIAVLGNGLATVYPPEHESLAADIAGAGSIVSELPADCIPDAKNFPRRNRIIIGLSLGVIVVEAGQRSGALISARLASEYNREVFAVPGRVDRPEYSAGVNGLIRDGQAKLVTCLEDVLDELDQVGEIMRRGIAESLRDEAGSPDTGLPPAVGLTPDERAVYEALAGGLDDVDEISSSTKLETAQVTSILTSLQLKGLVQLLPGGRVVPRSRA